MFVNIGNGEFSSAKTINVPKTGTAYAIAASDMFGDGRPEIVIASTARKKGEKSIVSLRPERVAINSSEKFENNFDAKVKELIYLGDHIRSRVEVCGNDQFIVKIPNSYMGANLKEGATVKLSWKASDSRALDLN